MSASLHLGRFQPRAAGRALRRVGALRRTPGLVSARPVALARFETTFGGTITPLRWGFWCGWEDDAARDAGFAAAARFTDGADEAWSVSLETVRVRLGEQWGGWVPRTDDVARLTKDEPIAVLTSGRISARHLATFHIQNQRVYRELAEAPGLGVHVGLADHPLMRSTFSLWRDQGSMVWAAYGPTTRHSTVQKRSLAVPWGNEWFFARFRPVASTGTWDGADPLVML